MNKIFASILLMLCGLLGVAFVAPTSRSTVVVDEDNVLLEPNTQELRESNGIVVGDDKKYQILFDTTPTASLETKNKTLAINIPKINISDIQQEKINKGELCFDVGRQTVPTGVVYSQLDLTMPFSVLARVKMMDTTGRFSINTADYNTGKRGFMLFLQTLATNVWRLFSFRGDGSTTYIEIAMPNITDAKYHTIELSYDGTYLTLYVDGNIAKRTNGTDARITPNWNTMTSHYATEPIFIGAPQNMSNNTMKGYVRDVCAFNFNVRDSSVPYTINDYNNGVDIPPSLLNINASQRAIYVLAPYTLNKRTIDLSGNGINLPTSGNVAGSTDTEVASLYKAFTGQTATGITPVSLPSTEIDSYFLSSLRSALNGDGTAYTATYTYSDDSIVSDYWSDVDFQILSQNGTLEYWVSTQRGVLTGGGYETNTATDLNAKIYYTCADYGTGESWILFEYNSVDARNIYEHAQKITGVQSPRICSVMIEPNVSGNTVGGTSIDDIFNDNEMQSQVFLKSTPLNYEKTSGNKPIWRTINSKSQVLWNLK